MKVIVMLCMLMVTIYAGAMEKDNAKSESILSSSAPLATNDSNLGQRRLTKSRSAEQKRISTSSRENKLTQSLFECLQSTASVMLQKAQHPEHDQHNVDDNLVINKLTELVAQLHEDTKTKDETTKNTLTVWTAEHDYVAAQVALLMAQTLRDNRITSREKLC